MFKRKSLKILSTLIVIAMIVGMGLTENPLYEGNIFQFGERANAAPNVIAISASKDAYVTSSSPKNNYNVADIDVGMGAEALIYWDISSIPKNSIQSAKLILYGANAYDQSLNTYIRVVPIASSWEENQVTYSTMPSLNVRNMKDFSISTLYANSGNEFDITDIVKAWKDGGSANYGMNIIGPSNISMQFFAKEANANIGGYRTAKLIITCTHPPTLSVISPLENQMFATSINLQGTCNDEDIGDIITVKYNMDGGTTRIINNSVTSIGDPLSFTPTDIDLHGLPEGNHNLSVWAEDNKGGSSVAITRRFILDRTTPIITISRVTDGQTYQEAITPIFSAIDASGIQSTTATLDEQPYTSGTPIAGIGGHTLIVTAVDIAGNQSQKTVNFFINKAPIITIPTADNTMFSVLETFVPTIEVEDNDSTTLVCKYYIDGETTQRDTKATSSRQTVTFKPLNMTLLQSGAHTLKFQVSDGLNTVDRIIHFTIDKKSFVTKITTIRHNTSLEIDWSPAPGATSYDIEVDSEVRNIGTKTTYTHTGLKPNTQHTYRIRAKNIYGASDWSALQTIMTGNNVPSDAPIFTSSIVTNTTAILTWVPVLDAESYDIDEKINGNYVNVVENWTSKSFEKKGLAPNSQHTYRVRARNSVGPSQAWSLDKDITTCLLDTPTNIKTEKNDDSIKLSWDAVPGAESYEVYLNGQLLNTVTTTSYLHGNLTSETDYSYKIQAKNSSGSSSMTNEILVSTLPKKPAVPTNVSATVGEKLIIVTWDKVQDTTGSSIEGYDVELDGVILENNNDAKYIHDELEPYTVHTYRVRARNSAIEGDWSELQSIRTLPAIPTAPKNVTIKSTSTSATLAWDAVPSATSYDVEVYDSSETLIKTVKNIIDTGYTYRKTKLGAEYRFKIITHNEVGVSKATGFIINNALKADCTKNNSIDLGLTATDVVDFSSYTMTVTYNQGVIDVTDLCTQTGNPELTAGKIEGTGITIKEFTPGKIVFVVDKAVTPGEAWTGVINSIKFKAKVTGGTTITYTVYTKAE